jgi:hypothetical protein
MDTETHGRFRDALAAAVNRAPQYGADAMLVLGLNVTKLRFDRVLYTWAKPPSTNNSVPVT